ncbi:DinB family protein [Neptunicella sp.]|uniref:DinB family protein n=1 Tax=Neptunicella sp. TaxID=2125986 RepID=UPI003F69170C
MVQSQTSYTMQAHFNLAAEYNQWMNNNLYQLVSQLDEDTFTQQKGAFFGSIAGTLNHIMVADIIWLTRFKAHPTGFSSLNGMTDFPSPKALSSILFADFSSLHQARKKLDNVIIDMCQQIRDIDLVTRLSYHNTKGHAFNKKWGFVLQHFFNHQTHHRGQVTTLLSQMEIDCGITDLLMITPDET